MRGKVKREKGTHLGDYTTNYGSSAGSQSAIERSSSLLSNIQQIKVETERFGGAAAERDAEMNGWKWGQCHAVSFTMQGWEGISLAYITLSPPSPPLTSPSPPHTHTLPPLFWDHKMWRWPICYSSVSDIFLCFVAHLLRRQEEAENEETTKMKDDEG